MSFSQSHSDIYGKKEVDLEKMMVDLEESFEHSTCGHCGKMFFKTYFVICENCIR